MRTSATSYVLVTPRTIPTPTPPVIVYTWSPPAIFPLDEGVPIQNTDTYSAAYSLNGAFVSMTSGQAGSTFSNTSVFSNDLYPPGDALILGEVLFSVYFASPGLKQFNYSVLPVSGSFNDPSGNNGNRLYLYSLDGVTIIDQDSHPDSGSITTVLGVTVPESGQYLINFHTDRNGPSPGSFMQVAVNFILGAGDQMALVI